MTHPMSPSAADPAAETAPAAQAADATAAAPTAPPPPQGWVATLQSIWQDLPGLVSDRVDLLSLELLRAGRALVQIIALVVAAAIVGLTAWLALWAGAAVGLVALGLHWSLAWLLVLGLNAGIAWLAIARLRLLLPLLRLPATRRHLRLGQNTEPPTPAAPPTPSRADIGAALPQVPAQSG